MIQMKKVLVKFTGYIEVECNEKDSAEDRLKTLCDDNEIELESPQVLKTSYECERCGVFAEKFERFEDSRGNDQECCKECFDNWSEDEDDNDGDR